MPRRSLPDASTRCSTPPRPVRSPSCARGPARSATPPRGPTPKPRDRRIHRDRHLHTWIDDVTGAGCGRWSTTPAAHAEILAALEPLRDKAFHEGRHSARRERPEAYAVDALHLLATQETSGAAAAPGANAKIIVRTDLSALLRGHPTDGEVCEVAGLGPVPVSAVRRWMDNAFLAAIVTDGVDVRSVTHLGRKATAAQRTALEWIAPACTVEGCGRTVHLEIDHRVDWATTHHTVLDELDRLCPHHHGLKTRDGYQLVPGTGRRPFLPPGPKAPPGSDPGRGREPPPDQPPEQLGLLDTG